MERKGYLMPNLPLWLCLLLIVIVAVFAAVVAFAAGIAHRKKIAEAVIGSAEEESKRIVNDAIKT